MIEKTPADSPLGQDVPAERPLDAEDTLPFDFEQELFVPANLRVRKWRRVKREERRAYWNRDVQSLSKMELRQLQQEDETLATIRGSLKKPTEVEGGDCYEEDGFIYRRWIPQGHSGEMDVQQLVLPQQCRSTVLSLAHSIPLSGHLGRKKTGDQILQRFYWLTLFRDVAEKCWTYPECQRTASRPRAIAPLIPLPIIEVPFQKIAMDIIGPSSTESYWKQVRVGDMRLCKPLSRGNSCTFD